MQTPPTTQVTSVWDLWLATSELTRESSKPPTVHHQHRCPSPMPSPCLSCGAWSLCFDDPSIRAYESLVGSMFHVLCAFLYVKEPHTAHLAVHPTKLPLSELTPGESDGTDTSTNGPLFGTLAQVPSRRPGSFHFSWTITPGRERKVLGRSSDHHSTRPETIELGVYSLYIQAQRPVSIHHPRVSHVFLLLGSRTRRFSPHAFG